MSDKYPLDKVMYFSASQKSEPSNLPVMKSMVEWEGQRDLYFALENTKPLSVVYNEAIDLAKEGDYNALILVHDDVIIEHDPIPKLQSLFTEYGLVGVAGCSKVELAPPALWHLMGGGFQGANLHGAVAHGTEKKKVMTSFGPYPHRVLMIDGVFMALTRETYNTVRFDESNPAKFHFYDLDYSYQCVLNKIKVGVGDISITHMSQGLKEFTSEWKAGQEWFLNKHTS